MSNEWDVHSLQVCIGSNKKGQILNLYKSKQHRASGPDKLHFLTLALFLSSMAL